MYVIKFSNNTYWCGYNHVDTELRKATIYVSLKTCESSAEDALNRLLIMDRLPAGTTYQIVEIEIKEVLN